MRHSVLFRPLRPRWAGLVFAAVLLFAGLPAVPAGAQTTQVDVTIADFYFSPANISIPPGTVVNWVNHGPSQHTTTSDNGAWNSGTLNPGGAFPVRFDASGSFTYHCSIHPQMVGTVVVGGQPASTQPAIPPPFGYSPYGSAPGYPPYAPYGYPPGYQPYAPQTPYPPYGYPPGYMPYAPYPGYAPYGAPPPSMPYPPYPGYHHAHYW